MASFTGSGLKEVYKDILHTSNSNTGIGSTIKQITCGDGDTSALYLSDRNLKIQPSTDTTSTTAIYDADGNLSSTFIESGTLEMSASLVTPESPSPLLAPSSSPSRPFPIFLP